MVDWQYLPSRPRFRPSRLILPRWAMWKVQPLPRFLPLCICKNAHWEVRDKLVATADNPWKRTMNCLDRRRLECRDIHYGSGHTRYLDLYRSVEARESTRCP